MTLALGLLAGVKLCSAEAPENAVYKELIEKGVPLSNGEAAKMPEFEMADGLEETAQGDALEAILKKDEGGVKKASLMSKKVTAPYIRVNTDIPNSTSHRIDLYFFAEGNLRTVANGNFWKARIGQQNKNGRLDFLTDQQLKQLKLTVVDQPNIKERYAHADVDLFSMVQVSGTARTMETIGKESVVVAFLLDPRFQNDKNFPNQWRPIKFNAVGKPVIGGPQPYDGVGGYAKATQFLALPGMLFVEYHIIYNEPQEWFNGKGVLDSKLSTMIEEDVRRFRRDLKAAPAGAGAGAPAAAGQIQPQAGPQAAASAPSSPAKK